MNALFNFIVKPKTTRHNSKKSVEGKELILNTELQNHQYVSRVGVVVAIPKAIKTYVNVGDEIIVHHNVFRRFYDIRGNEKNSKSYFDDNTFFVALDQIFAYKENDEWKPLNGFNFVAPIHNSLKYSNEKEQPLMGVMKYKDAELNQIQKGDIVGFKPGSEYEFIIDNQKLYRVSTSSITIKYDNKRSEKEYNPSWA